MSDPIPPSGGPDFTPLAPPPPPITFSFTPPPDSLSSSDLEFINNSLSQLNLPPSRLSILEFTGLLQEGSRELLLQLIEQAFENNRQQLLALASIIAELENLYAQAEALFLSHQALVEQMNATAGQIQTLGNSIPDKAEAYNTAQGEYIDARDEYNEAANDFPIRVNEIGYDAAKAEFDAIAADYLAKKAALETAALDYNNVYISINALVDQYNAFTAQIQSEQQEFGIPSDQGFVIFNPPEPLNLSSYVIPDLNLDDPYTLPATDPRLVPPYTLPTIPEISSDPPTIILPGFPFPFNIFDDPALSIFENYRDVHIDLSPYLEVRYVIASLDLARTMPYLQQLLERDQVALLFLFLKRGQATSEVYEPVASSLGGGGISGSQGISLASSVLGLSSPRLQGALGNILAGTNTKELFYNLDLNLNDQGIKNIPPKILVRLAFDLFTNLRAATKASLFIAQNTTPGTVSVTVAALSGISDALSKAIREGNIQDDVNSLLGASALPEEQRQELLQTVGNLVEFTLTSALISDINLQATLDVDLGAELSALSLLAGLIEALPKEATLSPELTALLEKILPLISPQTAGQIKAPLNSVEAFQKALQEEGGLPLAEALREGRDALFAASLNDNLEGELSPQSLKTLVSDLLKALNSVEKLRDDTFVKLPEKQGMEATDKAVDEVSTQKREVISTQNFENFAKLYLAAVGSIWGEGVLKDNINLRTDTGPAGISIPA